MKNFVKYLVLFMICPLVHTQDLPQGKLPVDPGMRKGVLPNGMTYYLYPTDIKKDLASFYIIQNVGSVLENDDEQGLAHFLEHMAFNGTASFPGKTLLNTLEKHGLKFGADINAYTSFDETVYNLSRIPTTPTLLDLGLDILHDWSNYITLKEEEIDAERGVVREEERTRDNARMRISRQLLGTEFGNSKYADRLPIGTMEVVNNFEYETLRNFYHKWYRTDLQAIAIVGDIDVAELETKIKAKFSQIPAVKNGPERSDIVIADNEKPLFATASDPEIKSATISFKIRYDTPSEKNTMAYLRYSLLNRIINNAFGKRFNKLRLEPDAPFSSIWAFIGPLSRKHDNLSAGVKSKPNQQRESFKTLMNELNRAVKFGFTNAEIDLAKNQIKKNYSDNAKNAENRNHSNILASMKSDYLDNKTFLDPVTATALINTILDGIESGDVNSRMKEAYTVTNRSVSTVAVDGDKNLTKKEIFKIIKNAEENKALQPYEEETVPKTLMDTSKLVAGKIISETENEEVGFTTFLLSNGIKVHYKFADIQKNDFRLQAHSYGGKSLLPLSYRPSALLLSQVARYSGFGDFSNTQISDFLADKSARAYFGMNEIEETITGRVKSTEDMETMMQLVHQSFTNPRLNKKGFDLMMRDMDRQLQDHGRIEHIMRDSMDVSVYGKNHPVMKLINRAFLDDLKLEKMQEIYQERFGNPADFNFYAVGDFPKDSLKPLLEKYIASMPTNNHRETFRDNTEDWNWVAKKIDKVIPLAMKKPKGTVRIEMKKAVPTYIRKDALAFVLLSDILKLRYTEALREKSGGTYGVSVYGKINRLPSVTAKLNISFDCNPELTDKLVGLIYEEIEKLKKGTIIEKDLASVKSNLLKQGKDSKNNNGYYLTLIKEYVTRDGLNIDLPKNFDDIIVSITADDIKDVANKLLEENDAYKIVFIPNGEEYKGL